MLSRLVISASKRLNTCVAPRLTRGLTRLSGVKRVPVAVALSKPRPFAFASPSVSAGGAAGLRPTALIPFRSLHASVGLRECHDHKGTFTCKAFVQSPAPDFTADAVVDGAFKSISLSQYRGKWLVLFFYPLDFTFVCPTEIIAFSERAKEFRAIDTELVAASVDSQFSHLAWVNLPRKDGGLGKMNIPILADITKQISKDYGVLLPSGISLRGLFIIDPKGTLRQITVNDLPIGRSVDETLRLVKALQFNEKHGEVCPADWKPGAATMKDNPWDSKAYFSKVNK